MTNKLLTPTESIEAKIFITRDQRVMLDSDLATIYGVPTKRLNEQVKRNLSRFPEDFMFQLTKDEVESLRSQNATSKEGKGGRRYLPFVFTEHGALMLANILSSAQAIEASIYVVRAFVRLREILLANKELAQKLNDLERQVGTHDEAIKSLINAVRQLMQPLQGSRRNIGFLGKAKKGGVPTP